MLEVLLCTWWHSKPNSPKSKRIQLTFSSGGKDEGLFAGGIIGSVFFPTQPKVFELEWQFDRFLNQTGCSGTFDEMGCLRSQNTTVLQSANVPSPYPGQKTSPLFYWTPTMDGNFLEDYPYILYEKGNFIKVPILIGGKQYSHFQVSRDRN